MKYKLEIDIDLPREKVVELFDNPENLKHWQPGFVGMKHMEGTPGEVGSKTHLKYQMGKRTVEMVETILSRDMPEGFSATYEAKGVWNEIHNFFHEAAPDKTRWVTENEFRFKGLMKIMGLIMPGAFKKQSFEYMELFKAFAEKSASE